MMDDKYTKTIVPREAVESGAYKDCARGTWPCHATDFRVRPSLRPHESVHYVCEEMRHRQMAGPGAIAAILPCLLDANRNVNDTATLNRIAYCLWAKILATVVHRHEESCSEALEDAYRYTEASGLGRKRLCASC